MNTKRSYGNKGVALIECINPYMKKYRVRWDVQDYRDEMNPDVERVSFLETDMVLTYKPRVFDVKNTILSAINQMVDSQILSGYVWKETPVWLSTENQFNYKAAYDMAMQIGEAALPVVFKFGTTENPVYHEFTTLEELQEFYIGAMNHISETLKQGWQMKDSVDWSEYQCWIKKLNE